MDKVTVTIISQSGEKQEISFLMNDKEEAKRAIASIMEHIAETWGD